MTKVKVIGGLGNQLFQYFFARTLKIKLNTKVELDISDFSIYKLHDFNLNNLLNVKLIISKKKKILQKFFLKKKKELDPFKFDHKIFNEKYSFYDGYWQSYKYFDKYWYIFKKDLKNEKHIINLGILKKIRNSNSVSVHIRRGDYVENTKTSKFHGNLDVNYYKKAIKFFENKYTNVEFFFFSDDIKWTKKMFVNKKYHFIKNKKKQIRDPSIDLILMKNCKHNIIANSTFSWWGAWLNENKNKIVCAPRQWTVNRKITETDLVPKGWKII